ncbi:hypothetical protein Tco_0931719 [Tanacetum coccineum]
MERVLIHLVWLAMGLGFHGLSIGFGLTSLLSFPILYYELSYDIMEMTDTFRIPISRAPEKVLIKEEAKSPVTKNVNFISLIRGEEEKSDKDDVATGDGIEKTNGSDTKMPVKEAETKNGAENRTKNKPIKRSEK